MQKALIVFLLVVTVACKEVTFKEPQPIGVKSLTEIPTTLRGTYRMEGEEEKDTVLITAKGYFAGADKKDQGVLSDSIILKEYKGYYFLNINDRPEWILRILKREKNGDLSMLSMETEEDKFQDFLLELSREVRIDSTTINEKQLYQIEPNAKQLVELINKGYFRKTVVLKKIK